MSTILVSIAASTRRPRGGLCCEGVEERDGVGASVAGEVAVVAVDHREAGAHEPREVEDGDAGAEREGGVGVAQVLGVLTTDV